MFIDWDLICKKLQALRIQSGITQEEFAKIVNYSQQTVSAFENGLTNNAMLLIGYLILIPETLNAVKEVISNGTIN